MNERWMKGPLTLAALLAVPLWVGCAAESDSAVGSRQTNLESAPGETEMDALPVAGYGETEEGSESIDGESMSSEEDGESISDSMSDDEGCGDEDSDSMSDDDGDDDDGDGIIDEADEDSMSDEDDDSSSDGDDCGEGSTPPVDEAPMVAAEEPV